MEQITISSETFQQALAWMNGTADEIHQNEVTTMMRSLNRAYREASRRRNPDGPVPRVGPQASSYPPTLSSIAGEQIARSVAKAPVKEEGTEGQDAMDSTVMLNSISHVCRCCGYPVSQSRAQLILLCVYGCFLASGRGRLPIEHPQAWRYGPVFPRAYKKGCIDDAQMCSRDYSRLCREHPDVAKVLHGKSVSLMATPMYDLSSVHKGPDSPYGMTVRSNPDRWGVQIPDDVLAGFFTR